MKRFIWLVIIMAGVLLVLAAQDINIVITKGDRPAIAIPDLHGSGNAQNFMGPFNQTLHGDIESSGLFKIVPLTSMPQFKPQRPSDFVTPPPVDNNPRPRRGE